MFHEESVVLGVLCWRGTPNGEWTEYTAQQLTRKLLHTEKLRNQELEAALREARDMILAEVLYDGNDEDRWLEKVSFLLCSSQETLSDREGK